MIKGVHTMFYTSEADAMRAFFRDTLGFSFTDVGGGWLIFDAPAADIGCHPADTPDGEPSGTHMISFYCDDLNATMSDLESRGVQFEGGVTDEGYGLVTRMQVPGGFSVQLYQPLYER